MSKLAIHGGTPVRKKLFPAYRVIDDKEKKAVAKVLDSGVLSRFLGTWHEDFYGGPQVQSMEKEWASYFGVKYAIAVNSCTSGLYAAIGAAGIEPGDEVIVSPYSMTASATAPLIYGGVPVFADIEEDYFCLDSQSVESRITARTKAIIVVDIFGLPYDATHINRIACKHNLVVIEDCAQSPGAYYKKKYAGTLADIGVYSLNYHKHIHCGEGGIVVTDSDELAERVQLIRNHAEAVVEAKQMKNIINMVGFNYRMTEIEAAITRCQLKKLRRLVEQRQKNCEYLEKRLSQIPCFEMPKVRKDCTHAYYVHAIKFKEEIAEVSRDVFISAVKAELPATELREQEGVRIGCGYIKPLYLQPMYQKNIAFGSKGFPFQQTKKKIKKRYAKGECPVAERMYYKELFTHELMRPPMTTEDLDDVISAFEKVWENRKSLSGK
ncbi:DegT/DnrJ/EryC1/StrS family aminotransferase [Candidatus Pacearchaeota archaeon]|nr:DegT/DnrJ/EryC1/StrS family aminotransferase [Candidatus Pacearchaeota archaeon]